MLIQWFPGHMTKALRKTEEDLKICDGVIYVLDARAPFACINEKLNALFKNKPIVYCINKTDLISSSAAAEISKKFSEKGVVYELISGFSKKDCERLKRACVNILKEKTEKDRAKGIKRTMRFMVAGIPNTGKSTVINTLCGGKRAETGDKAGVTRSNKWIRLGGFDLLDTPGTTPPSFENQTYAKHLAYIGAINDDVLDIEELAAELLAELKTVAKGVADEKYGVDRGDMGGAEILREICKKRGYLKKGGEVDVERGAKAVIDDLRKGRLGKICFE